MHMYLVFSRIYMYWLLPDTRTTAEKGLNLCLVSVWGSGC